LTAKAQKITIKLPWEVTTIYSEALKQSGHQSDDEEDEDDLEAQEASLERLKVTPTDHGPNNRLKPER
jgi:transcription initiation protein SPT3